jgi:hypothetical protein
MIGKLEFDLDDINEFRDHQCALKGRDLAFVFYDIKATLNAKINNTFDRRKLAIYRELLKEIDNGLEEREINLDHLIS